MATKRTTTKAAPKSRRKVESSGMIPLHRTPEELRDVAESQRAWMHDIAGMIERGEPLQVFDRHCAAAALRAFANAIPTTPKRGRGAPSTFARGDAALLVAAVKQGKGWTEEKAIAYAASIHDVPEETIKSAFNDYRKATEGFFTALGSGARTHIRDVQQAFPEGNPTKRKR